MKYIYLSLLISCVYAFRENSQFIFKNDAIPDDEFNKDIHYCEAKTLNPEEYQEIPGFSLKGVQLITRHGDRTPLTIIKDNEEDVWQCQKPKEYVTLNDINNGVRTNVEFIDTAADPDYNNPFLNKHFWKGTCFPGQLTEKGSLQHQNIGKNLRKVYIDKLNFLSEDNLERFYVRSTNVMRTRLSVQSLLSTFMKNATDPITIHTIPEEIEIMFPNVKACKKLGKILKKMSKDDEWNDYLKKNEELKAKLDKYLGYELNKIKLGMKKYVDTVLPRKCHNMLAKCKNDVCLNYNDIQQLNDDADFEYIYVYANKKYGKEFLTPGIGYFLREIINNMGNNLGDLKYTDKPKPANFIIYSGHDNTIAPILSALGAENMEWPPYASNLIFELWKDDEAAENSVDFGDYIVRIIYNGEVLKTDWCDFNKCSLSSLYMRFKNYFPLIDECFE